MNKRLIIAIALLMLAACRNEKKPVPPPEAPMTEATTVTDSQSDIATEDDSVTEDPNGTSVKIGPQGISVKTGDADKKTHVDIKAGQGAKINVTAPQ